MAFRSQNTLVASCNAISLCLWPLVLVTRIECGAEEVVQQRDRRAGLFLSCQSSWLFFFFFSPWFHSSLCNSVATLNPNICSWECLKCVIYKDSSGLEARSLNSLTTLLEEENNKSTRRTVRPKYFLKDPKWIKRTVYKKKMTFSI